jgi:VIT1/CCC1 family predicted Fe2+/Mn2+ transporter
MKKTERHYNWNAGFIHHQTAAYLYGREIVFGMQDGMVSALSAITGIAVGSGNDHFIVLLSGLAIISAGAISMAIGTFTSLSSQKKMEKQMLREELSEIRNNLAEEKKELEQKYVRDGWKTGLACQMASAAGSDEKLILKEMAYRELKIDPNANQNVIINSIAMFFAWLIGGIFPLAPYFFLPVESGIVFSICFTLFGLFFLGVATSIYTKENWLRAGLKIFILAGLSIIVCYTLGHLADMLILH